MTSHTSDVNKNNTRYIFFDCPPSQPEFKDIWEQISFLRHKVFASELGQFETNFEERLDDPGSWFIVCVVNNTLAGYISLTPPDKRSFRICKYFSDQILQETILSLVEDRLSTTYEVRALTVSREFRRRRISYHLMAFALQIVLEKGGTDFVSMGHSNVIQLYKKIGCTVFSKHYIQHGETKYYPMHINLQKACTINAEILFGRKERACYHGGDSWKISHFDFDARNSLVVADVLDCPFPPCPEVLQLLHENLERCCRESPPVQCDELIAKIAECRHVNPEHVAVSSGSSSLMFSLLPRLIARHSKVVILSPMYGEYKHILDYIIGCEITIIKLRKENNFRIDEYEIIQQARQHDALIVANPNNPTGAYCDLLSDIIQKIQDESSTPTTCKLIWVDETYIDYVPDVESLESLVKNNPSLLISKSMSKSYALSGLRVGYAVSQKMIALRRFIPPWSVSLPAQIAAIAALNNPGYYTNQYTEIHRKRHEMTEHLKKLNFDVLPGVANFILAFLPQDTAHSSLTFVDACKAKGVFIRDARSMDLVDAVRFGIRTAAENERIIKCVEEVLSEF